MKCCICGTVKNCGLYLDKVLKNIEIIATLFDDYRIIIYYDDSTDNSLFILNEYKKHNNKLYIHINKDILSEYRTYNISKGRNTCLKYITSKYSDYEMFIMMDMDDVNCKEVNIDILKKYLIRDDWDSLSFNTTPIYYDIWALSINPYFLSFFAFEKTNEIYNIMLENITTLLKKLQPAELLNCASAFNGFAIYRTKKFINCNYDGRLRLDLLPFKHIYNKNNVVNSKFLFPKDDCEHRAFHFQAINKNQAKIKISSDILFT